MDPSAEQMMIRGADEPTGVLIVLGVEMGDSMVKVGSVLYLIIASLGACELWSRNIARF